MRLNILIRGQSNAALLYRDGQAAALAARVAALLGFDGVADQVVLLGGAGRSVFPGTPLLPSPAVLPDATPWLIPATGTTTPPWSDGVEQRTLDAYLAALPATIRAAPTAIVWMHNESDSLNVAITPTEWADAAAQAIAEDRAALGQPAAAAPVDFVNVPYDVGRSTLETDWQGGAAQQIRQGMQALIDRPGFDAAWGAQIGDADMNATDPFYGGEHMTAADLARLAPRLALTVARQFAAYARPGAPIATAAGADTSGPSVAAATLPADAPGQVLVQLAVPAAAGGLSALSAPAAAGAGWTVRDGDSVRHATGARLLDGARLRLDFGAPLPADAAARLFYGYGSGRLYAATAPPTAADPQQGPGQDAAIYDARALPLQPTPYGIALGATGAAGAATVTPGAGSTTVRAAASAIEVQNGRGDASVLCGPGDATVRGGAGRVTVQGAGGALLAAGGLAGGNVLAAGAGAARLIGASGDTLVGGSGVTHAFIGLGRTVFFGGSGVGTVIGSHAPASDLTAVGGSGALMLYEGAGRNAVWGGSGTATVVSGDGTDFVAGGVGTLVAVGGSGGGGSGDTIMGGAAASAQTLVQGGAGPLLLVGRQGLDVLWGGSGPATVFGGAGISTVFGATGATQVIAGPGPTFVRAGSGAMDVLTGATAGSTTLTAASGNMTLWGEGGGPVDVVVNRGAAGGAVVLNGFRDGIDHIVLQGFSAAEEARAIASAVPIGAAGMQLTLSDGTHIVLWGLGAGDINAALFE